MTKQEISKLFQQVKDILKDKIKKKGEVFYNSYTSLSRGDVYILGINPGYGGEKNLEEKLTIEGQLDEKLSDGENAESIFDKELHGNANWYHKNSIQFIESMGLNYKKVFATNAFFEITKNSEKLNLKDFEKYYWPVHKLFLDIIQPKVIICIGYGDPSSFSLLKKVFKKDGKIIKENQDNICKSCNCLKYKSFDVCDSNGNRKYRIYGVMHFSWNKNKDNIKIIAKEIKEEIQNDFDIVIKKMNLKNGR